MSAEILAILDNAWAFGSPQAFCEECDTILVYGAGNMGRDVLRAMNSQGIKAAGFLDKKATPQAQLEGVPVYPPHWDGLSMSQRQRTSVVIALHNGDVEIPPITGYLRDRGYGRIVSLVEFYDRFSEVLGDRFWLTSRSSYRAWEKGICEGYETWEDEHSRQLYSSLLRFRLTGDYNELPLVDSDTQYFPTTIPSWRNPLRFVDGGAFDGDTLRSAADSQYAIEAAIAFEPDPVNYARLEGYVLSLANKDIQVWPCGIYSSTTRLSFTANGLQSSKPDEKGNTSVRVVALDDAIASFRPNLIKFDIEGAEHEGLLGANRVVCENRPGLAICLYHRPQDMWQIPLLIKRWDLGYRLFMRAHKNNDFEVVMYGTI
jgi:FkbM family methyltransferase